MPTPGSIKRRVTGAWQQEGSYVLVVPNAAALPAAPDEDDVFAFTHDAQVMYYSRAGAWLRYTSPPIFATTALRDSDWASPPNGSLCVTLDTNQTWQRRSGVWQPQVGSFLTAYTVTLSGSNIGASNVTVGTINIPSAAYTRNMRLSFQLLPGGTTASSFQTNVYLNAGFILASRVPGGNGTTAGGSGSFSLAANQAHTVRCDELRLSGSDLGTVPNDGTLCRMDATIFVT